MRSAEHDPVWASSQEAQLAFWDEVAPADAVQEPDASVWTPLMPNWQIRVPLREFYDGLQDAVARNDPAAARNYLKAYRLELEQRKREPGTGRLNPELVLRACLLSRWGGVRAPRVTIPRSVAPRRGAPRGRRPRVRARAVASRDGPLPSSDDDPDPPSRLAAPREREVAA
jgi:hypothetical protein